MNSNFNKLTLIQEDNFNVIPYPEMSNSSSKIKISIPSDLVDDYLNFDHSETHSISDDKLKLEKNPSQIINDIQNEINNININSLSRRNSTQIVTNKIFLINKTNKKRNSQKLPKISKNRKQSNLSRKKMSLCISRKSSTSLKEDITHKPTSSFNSNNHNEDHTPSNNMHRNIDLNYNIIKNEYVNNINNNPSQTTKTSIADNPIPPSINSNNNHLSIDPIKNHLINIVNINIASNNNPIQDKEDTHIILNNILNYISRKSGKNITIMVNY